MHANSIVSFLWVQANYQILQKEQGIEQPTVVTPIAASSRSLTPPVQNIAFNNDEKCDPSLRDSPVWPNRTELSLAITLTSDQLRGYHTGA
jgi:hypothetical protein